MFKKNFSILACGYMLSLFILDTSFAASGSSSGNSYTDLYAEAKKFVLRAKKLEEKNKMDRATKLYSKALGKLQKAYKSDKNNPDILNYLGFTLRKTGKLDEAEKYYLKGLKIKPNHNGINEYLGELYFNTGRLELAKERLAVLKNCNCEEYSELKEIIEKE
tara:strand:- start:636 stop:1121 length:486 start_codon:yes stop_codon:yes gene_type:complete